MGCLFDGDLFVVQVWRKLEDKKIRFVDAEAAQYSLDNSLRMRSLSSLEQFNVSFPKQVNRRWRMEKVNRIREDSGTLTPAAVGRTAKAQDPYTVRVGYRSAVRGHTRKTKSTSSLRASSRSVNGGSRAQVHRSTAKCTDCEGCCC